MNTATLYLSLKSSGIFFTRKEYFLDTFSAENTHYSKVFSEYFLPFNTEYLFFEKRVTLTERVLPSPIKSISGVYPKKEY